MKSILACIVSLSLALPPAYAGKTTPPKTVEPKMADYILPVEELLKLSPSDQAIYSIFIFHYVSVLEMTQVKNQMAIEVANAEADEEGFKIFALLENLIHFPNFRSLSVQLSFFPEAHAVAFLAAVPYVVGAARVAGPAIWRFGVKRAAPVIARYSKRYAGQAAQFAKTTYSRVTSSAGRRFAQFSKPAGRGAGNAKSAAPGPAAPAQPALRTIKGTPKGGLNRTLARSAKPAKVAKPAKPASESFPEGAPSFLGNAAKVKPVRAPRAPRAPKPTAAPSAAAPASAPTAVGPVRGALRTAGRVLTDKRVMAAGVVYTGVSMVADAYEVQNPANIPATGVASDELVASAEGALLADPNATVVDPTAAGAGTAEELAATDSSGGGSTGSRRENSLVDTGPGGGDEEEEIPVEAPVSGYKQAGSGCFFGLHTSTYVSRPNGNLSCPAPEGTVNADPCSGTRETKQFNCETFGMLTGADQQKTQTVGCVDFEPTADLTVRCATKLTDWMVNSSPTRLDTAAYSKWREDAIKRINEFETNFAQGMSLSAYCADGNKVNDGLQKDECTAITGLFATLRELSPAAGRAVAAVAAGAQGTGATGAAGGGQSPPVAAPRPGTIRTSDENNNPSAE